MHKLITFIVWCVLTVSIQILFLIGYAFYEGGGFGGSYDCSIGGPAFNCGLIDKALNFFFIFNLFFGLPTILSGLISWVIVKIWREGITSAK